MGSVELEKRIADLELRVGGGKAGTRTLERVKETSRSALLARRIERLTRSKE